MVLLEFEIKPNTKFDFNANEYANLRALNFITKNDSISIFKGKVTTSVKGSTIDDAYGTLNFEERLYCRNDECFFKDFKIVSKFVMISILYL
jgi:hypothetical protein